MEHCHEKYTPNCATDFSCKEKNLLINFFAKHKNVIENNKTNAASNHEKAKILNKITFGFNSVCIGNVVFINHNFQIPDSKLERKTRCASCNLFNYIP